MRQIVSLHFLLFDQMQYYFDWSKCVTNLVINRCRVSEQQSDLLESHGTMFSLGTFEKWKQFRQMNMWHTKPALIVQQEKLWGALTVFEQVEQKSLPKLRLQISFHSLKMSYEQSCAVNDSCS